MICSLLIIIQSIRVVMNILVSASKEIVGKHSFVGSTVAFIIIDEKFLDTVRTENRIALVLGIGEQQQTTHTLAAG